MPQHIPTKEAGGYRLIETLGLESLFRDTTYEIHAQKMPNGAVEYVAITETSRKDAPDVYFSEELHRGKGAEALELCRRWVRAQHIADCTAYVTTQPQTAMGGAR